MKNLLFTEANVVIVLHEVTQYLSMQNSPAAIDLSITINTMLNNAFKNTQARSEYEASKSSSKL